MNNFYDIPDFVLAFSDIENVVTVKKITKNIIQLKEALRYCFKLLITEFMCITFFFYNALL